MLSVIIGYNNRDFHTCPRFCLCWDFSYIISNGSSIFYYNIRRNKKQKYYKNVTKSHNMPCSF